MTGVFFLLFINVCWLGLYLLLRKKSLPFWHTYSMMVGILLIGLLVILIREGFISLYIFISGMIVGTLMEWIIGWFYHLITKNQLWSYHPYPMKGAYSSYLIIPFWGYATLAIWLLTREF